MAKFNATGVYAFVAWIASMVVFIVFLLWAFSPRSFLHAIGITYYPSRYYAIALPAYMIMLIFVINLGYIGINLMMTLEPDDMFTIRDGQTRVSPNVFLKCSVVGGIPDIGDIDRVEVSYLIFNQNEKKLASTAKIRKALS